MINSALPRDRDRLAGFGQGLVKQRLLNPAILHRQLLQLIKATAGKLDMQFNLRAGIERRNHLYMLNRSFNRIKRAVGHTLLGALPAKHKQNKQRRGQRSITLNAILLKRTNKLT